PGSAAAGARGPLLAAATPAAGAVAVPPWNARPADSAGGTGPRPARRTARTGRREIPGTAGYRRERERLRFLPACWRSSPYRATIETRALKMVAASAPYVITAVAVFMRVKKQPTSAGTVPPS